jgi:imidazole glycerol-phosphate synthase subunit HisH
MITIVDYGLGNLENVKRAIRVLGGEAHCTNNAKEIKEAQKLILPGVGAFGVGMENLKANDLAGAVRSFAFTGKPLLGICLGMQLLFTKSEELGSQQGLNLIEGEVIYFNNINSFDLANKIPHVGWNELTSPGESVSDIKENTILKGFPERSSVYFVHSLVVVPADPLFSMAETNYGDLNFCSVVKKDNITGCQFHPEMSGNAGLLILKNFLNFL